MTIKNCALCEDFKDKYWDWNLIQNPNIDFTTVSPQCKKNYAKTSQIGANGMKPPRKISWHQ